MTKPRLRLEISSLSQVVACFLHLSAADVVCAVHKTVLLIMLLCFLFLHGFKGGLVLQVKDAGTYGY